MSINSDKDGVEPGGIGVRQRVSISRWVNEPYPAWDRILTAHDVARLIRRPPWMLCSMAAIGQFPKRQRFRGKNIGWLKADILDWMARSSRSGVAATSA
jgi:predicted DNA-binding transcriptional regulator AlpA